MQSFITSSYLANADYLEDLYQQYLEDPASIPQEWQNYFKHLPQVSEAKEIPSSLLRMQLSQRADYASLMHPTQSQPLRNAEYERKQAAVDRLINAYRIYGHLIAHIDPLQAPRPRPEQLTLDFYSELSSEDLPHQFRTPPLFGKSQASLQEIIAYLESIYCGSLAAEYMYIENTQEVNWFKQRLEQKRIPLTPEEKREILKLLIDTDGLEKYLAAKYVAQKRFSLEGGDGLIPFLHAFNETATEHKVQEVVIGMAHRGRLNVLVNIFGKPPADLFKEFEGRKSFGLTSGDVKYHMGHASDIDTQSGPLHLSLAFNPSHLEIIDPVLMGSVSARQHRKDPESRFDVVGLLIHGDASIAGQGIVMETLNMSQTNAYHIGGIVHVVINNQVGFTTSDPQDARSSRYCTDIAKMIEAPVLHINGDDPEAIVFAARLAMDYRQAFKKDIFVDLVCYRRLGHNEADEPAATQPLMYNFIRQHVSPQEIYSRKLIAEQVCTQEEIDLWIHSYRDALDNHVAAVKTNTNGLATQYSGAWAPYIDQPWWIVADTTIAKDKLFELGKKLTELPEGFELQRQVGHVFAIRSKMTTGELPLDWGYAENLAYATLLDQGYPVRMSGEDCRRGTFAHRHAVLHDQKTDDTYCPLQHLSPHQANFEIYDSLLSEAGAMGFEYGYASTDPNTLVLWEAQYGDFVNGAQVIIDQFMSSAWQKWQTLSGLTLLLPHGYEGSGPEHTSARLERFLQLCAQKNMQVCNPTTPAQIFHLLRRQMIRPYRTPLVIMSPKSLLRHKQAVSSLNELSQGGFQLLIPETEIPIKNTKRLILCSGKVYYDLLSKRQEQKLEHIAILRMEQLYPFPHDELLTQLKQYTEVKDIIWCQEEPKNQGTWLVLRDRLEACLAKGQILHYTGRPSSASPAVGYMKLHVQQQTDLVNQALGL